MSGIRSRRLQSRMFKPSFMMPIPDIGTLIFSTLL
jgi:hypothetical protein